MRLVVDLSNNNRVDSFTKVKKAGVAGVFLKATEGVHFNDSVFDSNRKRANDAGLRVGAYHFARPDINTSGAVDEAHHFVKRIGHVNRRDLRPALDFETPSGKLTRSQMERWAHVFSQEVHKYLGVYPLFYTYSSMIVDLHLSKTVGAGLWLATYSKNDGREHPFVVPAPYKRAYIHQFTSNGRIPGVQGRVDLNNVNNLRAVLAHPITGLV